MKPKNRIATTDAQLDSALANAKLYEETRPRATGAKYLKSGDQLCVTLANGVEILIPRELLQGLQNASAADLAKVTVEDHGSMLRWEALDVDHYVPGLMEGILGTRAWMSEIGKKGGSARSQAKAKAAQENGLKGGRPRNTSGLDGRHRDTDGTVRVQGGNMRVDTLRQTYGDFAAGVRSDMKIETVLERRGTDSLNDALREGRPAHTHKKRSS